MSWVVLNAIHEDTSPVRMKFQKESDVVFLQFLSRNFMNYYQPLPKTHIEHGTFKMLYSVVGAFLNQEKIKFSLYSFHVIHDYLTIRRQTRGFYLLIVDKGRRSKSTIKVNRAPINVTGARVIKTITSCEIAIQMMPILGIQTSLLHLVFYSIFEHFVIFLLCIIKCVNHEKRLQI